MEFCIFFFSKNAKNKTKKMRFLFFFSPLLAQSKKVQKKIENWKIVCQTNCKDTKKKKNCKLEICQTTPTNLITCVCVCVSNLKVGRRVCAKKNAKQNQKTLLQKKQKYDNSATKSNTHTHTKRTKHTIISWPSLVIKYPPGFSFVWNKIEN